MHKQSKKKKVKVNEIAPEDYPLDVEGVSSEILAKLFVEAGSSHNHLAAGKNCDSPNCKTGFETGGPVFDDLDREKLIRESTGSSDDLRLLLRDVSESQTTGLRNLGTTCFMNALFQVLFATSPFRFGLYKFRHPTVVPKGETKASITRLKVIDEMQLLFARMERGNRSWLRPDIFPKLLGFPTNEQQDVQEFFMLLLASYCDSCFRMCDDTKTLFGDLFGANQNIGISCNVCKTESVRRELFYVLQLPLSDSVVESLKLTTQVEYLEGDNMYDCGMCQKRNTATRSTRLLAPPPVMVLQMLRFHYDTKTFNKVKKMTKVSAPRVLDMRPFVDASEASDKSLVYELYAIVLHIGNSAHGGHYVAHVLQSDGMWMELDDEETRALLPEEVGLTVSMRNPKNGNWESGGADEKGEEGPELGDDADFELDESPAKGKRRGRGKGKKGGAAGGGGGGGGDQKKVVVENLVDNTKGSPAPYLFFYRLQNHGWQKSVVPPPPYVMNQVEKENEQLLADHRLYSLICEETNRELDELHALYLSVVGDCEVNDSCWLSLEWFKAWVARPDASNVLPINNQLIVCPHGGVSHTTLKAMKRISTSAWDALIARYGGGPKLPHGSECKECVLAYCQAQMAVLQGEEKIMQIKNAVQEECSKKKSHFLMWSDWLNAWRKNPNSPDLDATINGPLICPHDSISATMNVFRVSADVWDYFKGKWPLAVELRGNRVMCEECREMDEALRKVAEGELSQRKLQSRKLDELLTRKNPYVLSKLDGPRLLVAREWVERLRVYVKDVAIPRLDPVDNSSLLCPHGKMKVRWKSEVQTDSGAGLLRSFFLVSEEQWSFLESTFNSDGTRITLNNGELSLEDCEECISSLLEQEAAAAKSFVRKQITIRQVDTGRSTTSNYSLRKKKGGGGSGGKGGMSFHLDASATDTVEMLKLAIFNVTDVDPVRVVLHFGGALLDDENRNLNSYGIVAGSTIDMSTALLDGVDEDEGSAAVASASASRGSRRPQKPEKGFQGSLLHGDFKNESNDPSDQSEGVSCPHCTYINHDETGVCLMCTGSLAPAKRNKSSD